MLFRMAVNSNAVVYMLAGYMEIMGIKRSVIEMEAARQIENFTVDDIYDLPDGKRAELLDGQIYFMAPPSTEHQRLAGKIFNKISNYIQDNHGTCETFIAPFAVFLDKDDKNYVEPDISVICDKGKLDDKGCHGAPDWMIEIVSPGSKRMDYYIKLFKYRTAGVREYWIVDSMEKCITVYDFEHEDVERYTFTDKIRVCIYENLEIDFSEILGY